MNKRTKITPCVCIFLGDQYGGLKIELELPRVNKKDISFEMMKEGFYLSAPSGEKEEYSSYFYLAQNVVPKREDE